MPGKVDFASVIAGDQDRGRQGPRVPTMTGEVGHRAVPNLQPLRAPTAEDDCVETWYGGDGWRARTVTSSLVGES
jgi:hypothetical protein